MRSTKGRGVSEWDLDTKISGHEMDTQTDGRTDRARPVDILTEKKLTKRENTPRAKKNTSTHHTFLIHNTERNSVAGLGGTSFDNICARSVLLHESSSLLCVAFIQKTFDGHIHFTWVSDIVSGVSKGKAERLNQKMEVGSRVVFFSGQVESFEDIESNKCSNALAVGRNLPDVDAAVVDVDWVIEG